MIEIAAAIAAAGGAVKTIKQAMAVGRDAADLGAQFIKFFDAKEQIQEADIEHSNGPKLLSFLSKGSVEARAFEITLAKHKTAEMEKDLKELCYYTVGREFYENMMLERRRIRNARLDAARKRAAKKRAMIDGVLIVILLAAGIALISFMVWLIQTKGGR